VPGIRWNLAAASRRVRAVLGPALQASVAAGVAWYLAHNLLGHAQPFFAPIAAAVSLSTSHVQRARRSVQMIVGVLLGIGVSELLHPLLGNSALSIVLVVAITLLLAVALGVGFVGEGMMFFNQAASSAILVIALHKAGTGSERAIDALVGGGVALVIGVGLFPADPLKLLWSAERGVLRSLVGILQQRQPTKAGDGEDDAEMDWALAASHDVHRRLTALTQARRTARVSVRVAPRRMRMRPLVEAEERRVARLYLLSSAVLSLARASIDGIGGTTGGSVETRELSQVLQTLVDAPRPWPAGTARAVAERTHALLARPLPSGPAELASLAAASHRLACDVIGLLPDDP
jgi:uncharacterized membrane protein YgaE (UPF0421/DUF939 family)